MPAVGEVRLQLLGPIEVLCEGQPIVLGGPIVRQLFVQLALSPGAPITHERLVDAVWEDNAPATAPTALRVHMNRLRAGLRDAPVTVVHQPGGYLLVGAPVVLDVTELDRLEQLLADALDPVDALVTVDRALALWRGASMADVRRLPFAERLAAQLDRRLELLGWRREQLLVETGNGGSAIPHLEVRLRADRRDQAVWALLVRANCQIGRLATALDLCRRAREHLVERGLVPGRELEALEAQILNNEVSVGREPNVARPRMAPPVGLLATAPTELYGRRDELAQLDAFLDEVSVRRTSLVVRVTGEAGVGKTALASVFARSILANGVDVVHAWCEDTARHPLAPLTPVIAGFLDHPRRSRADASPFVPVVRRYLDERGVNDPALVDAGELRRQLIAGVCQVIDDACEQPVVLLLDDAHWADELTQAVLDELVRRPLRAPCLLVTFERERTEGPRGIPTIALRRLAQPALADWLSGSSAAVGLDTVMALTGGLPLLVDATLREMQGGADVESLSGQLSEFVWNARFNRLPARAMRPIRFAAVLGPRVQFDRLQLVTGQPELDLLEDLDAAVTAGILRPDRHDPSTYHFTHDLVRRSILDRCTPLHVRHLHAEILAHIGPSTTDPIAALYHGRRAIGHVGEAVLCQLTADAAAALLARSAFDEARSELEATLAVSADHARSRLLTLLARAEAASGEPTRAHARLDDALAAAQLVGDPEAIVEALVARSIFGHRFVNDPLIQATLRQAINRLPADNVALRIAGLQRLALERRDAGRTEESAEVLDELRPLADYITDPGARLSSLLIEHGVLEAAGRRDERRDTAARARLLGPADDDLEARYRLLMIELDECFLSGDEAGCERFMAEFALVADALGSPYMQWMIRAVRFTVPFRRAELALARKHSLDAYEFGHAAQVLGAYGARSTQLYAIEWVNGNLGPFVEPLRQVQVTGPSLPWRSGLALALAVRGDRDAATDVLDTLVPQIPVEGDYWLGFVGVAMSIEAASLCGHADAARASAPFMRRRRGDQVVLGTGAVDYGPAERYLALAELVVGERDAGERMLRAVVDDPNAGAIWRRRASVDLERHGFELPGFDRPAVGDAAEAAQADGDHWRWLLQP